LTAVTPAVVAIKPKSHWRSSTFVWYSIVLMVLVCALAIGASIVMGQLDSPWLKLIGDGLCAPLRFFDGLDNSPQGQSLGSAVVGVNTLQKIPRICMALWYISSSNGGRVCCPKGKFYSGGNCSRRRRSHGTVCYGTRKKPSPFNFR
jgi:hypothetical protein